MPSRASSETNNRADSCASRSASRSKPASTASVVSALEAASPCGDALASSPVTALTAKCTSSAVIVTNPMSTARPALNVSPVR